MSIRLTQLFVGMALIFSTAVTFSATSESIYTLYRNSVTNPSMRIHIATFDAAEEAKYNLENCELAKQLFQSQASVKTTFWCEPGRYRKSPTN